MVDPVLAVPYIVSIIEDKGYCLSKDCCNVYINCKSNELAIAGFILQILELCDVQH